MWLYDNLWYIWQDYHFDELIISSGMDGPVQGMNLLVTNHVYKSGTVCTFGILSTQQLWTLLWENNFDGSNG